jgi:hypothetical protein
MWTCTPVVLTAYGRLGMPSLHAWSATQGALPASCPRRWLTDSPLMGVLASLHVPCGAHIACAAVCQRHCHRVAHLGGAHGAQVHIRDGRTAAWARSQPVRRVRQQAVQVSVQVGSLVGGSGLGRCVRLQYVCSVWRSTGCMAAGMAQASWPLAAGMDCATTATLNNSQAASCS